MSAAPDPRFEAFARLPLPIAVVREGTVVFANTALRAVLRLGEADAFEGELQTVVNTRFGLADDEAGVSGEEPPAWQTRPDGEPFWLTVHDSAGGLHAVCGRRVTGPGAGEQTYIFHEAEGEAAVRRLSAALVEATGPLARLRTEDEVLACAVDAVYRQGLNALVHRLEGEHLQVVALRQRPEFHRAVQGHFGKRLSEVPLPVSTPPFAELLQQRRQRFFPDMHAVMARARGPAVAQALTDAGVSPERGMVTPLCVEGLPYGLFWVTGERLTPELEGTLGLFGQMVAGALESVRHHRRSEAQLLEVARLQEQLVRQARLAVLGEAAGVVAHEVRNPLAVILNSVALLRRDAGLGRASGELLDTLDEEVRRLEALVSDLVLVSRPLSPRFEPVELAPLVRRAVAQAASGRQPPIALEVEEALPPVSADAGLLQLALDNLLRSALQASPAEGPVAVRVARSADAVAVTVEDSGPPVAEQERERIFEPFFTTRAAGSGLSLTLVKRVADAHGAQLQVEPRADDGLAIHMLLPTQPPREAP